MTRVGVSGRTPQASELAEYLDALRDAGAEPVVLANAAERVADDLARVDGVLLTGGADVDPARYGRPRHPKTVEVAEPARDAYEIALVRAAREHDVPLFAICRGAQVANVAFGGTLVQDIPELIGSAIPHRRLCSDGTSDHAVFDEHVVAVVPESRLRTIVGREQFATGSRHHQAIEQVAGDLCAVARTADGVVEALEPLFAARFWLAVQWHPESTLADGGPSRALFAAFVAECGR